MKQTIRMAFLILVVAGSGLVAAQGTPPAVGTRPDGQAPLPPMPRPAIPAEFQKGLDAQRPAWEAYQACIRANEQAFKLSSLTRTLVEARNNKERYVALLKDPATPAHVKAKSYEDMVAEGMAEYRRLGGTARSIEEVTATANPCQHAQPGPRLPPERMTAQGGAPVSASASVAAVPVQTRPSGEPRQQTESRPAPRSSRANQDARECLALSDSKAIMACAEKYR